MTARISKYHPYFGIGWDLHGKLPPTSATPPPPAVGPLTPQSQWLVTIISHVMAVAVTGKWSKGSNYTEGYGDILWQYDWGPLQPHIPLTPPYITPSLAVLMAASSIKYWMPSFSVQEQIDGAPPAKAGGSAPVAVSTPVFFIPTQDCHDYGCSLSYYAPTSVCFQPISVRWVGFNGGDLAAGAIGLACDAAAAAALSYFGGKLFKGYIDNLLFGMIGGPLVTALVNWAMGSGGLSAAQTGIISGGVAAGAVAFPMLVGVAALFAGVGIAAGFCTLSNWGAGKVGTDYGSKKEDVGPVVPGTESLF